MSKEAHLAELDRRHRALEAEIAEARAHPSIDDLQIVELKRRKLLLKDEITRLQNLQQPMYVKGSRPRGLGFGHRQSCTRASACRGLP